MKKGAYMKVLIIMVKTKKETGSVLAYGEDGICWAKKYIVITLCNVIFFSREVATASCRPGFPHSRGFTNHTQ
jgi:hypothetical protein